jgi:uncharacterized protein
MQSKLLLRSAMFSIFLTLLFFISTYSLSSQSSFLDKKLTEYSYELDGINKRSHQKSKRGIGNFMLTLYQKHISVLISADCIYEISCSRYSRLAINKYGFIKGVLITADRLTRCSAGASKDIPYSKFNQDDLAQDNP